MKLPLILAVVLPLFVPLEPARQVWLFDDFESAEHVAAHELAWIALGDDLFGGTSTLELKTVGRGENGHALRLQGSVGSGPTAFTGAWAALDGQSRPVDLGAFDALRFFARGEGTFQAGLRSGPTNAMGNFMSSFTPGPDWKAFEIPFERLAPVGPGSSTARFQSEEVHWLGITTAAGAHGPFHLEIDDLELVSHRAGETRALPVAQPGPARTVRLVFVDVPSGAEWRDLARDPAGDGKQPSLPDVVSLAVMPDGGERVWFRISLQNELPPAWLGLNLAFDVDADTENGMPWWGANTAFQFDRLVTVWLFQTGLAYQGVAGTADAAAVAKGEFMTNGLDLQVAMDRGSRSFLVGVPRSVLGSGAEPRFLAAVGSAMAHNDDLPDTGAILLPR
jgi:Complex I intermediate-associated protein 30 (CIA30)